MAAASPSPGDPTFEARVQDVADRFLVDVRSGRGTSVKSVVEAHPDLAPELETRLAIIFALLRARDLPPEDGGKSDASALPSHLGRFQIVARIGSGTFGEVFRADDPVLGRTVALKVPRAGLFSSADEEERFFREARSAAHLKHPAIVQVHEIGRHGDLPFIVCDLIAGETLASRLAREPPDNRAAAELLAQVADALDFAHRLKIIHRDIKPQNILLDEAGRPHVTDFGLARRQDDESQMTLDGQVLGTPAYMPPEQAAGKRGAADGRSDVYSLGVVLYELLVGERPFRGERSVVVHQVLHAEPRPPRTVNESIPRDLETICLKAMAKEPGRRYPTAAAMAADLRAFLRGEPITARPARTPERVWRWCRRNPVPATMAALFLFLLAGTAVGSSVAVLWVNQARKEATDALAKSRRQLVHMTVASGQRHLQANDAMGALLYYAEALRLEEDDPIQEEVHRKRYQAVWRECPQWRIAASHSSWVFSADLSAAGDLIATACHDGTARIWSAATGELLQGPLGHGGPINWVAFSAGGSRVVTGSDDKSARVWDTSTGQPISPPLIHDAKVTVAQLSADGSLVATASDDGTARLWEAASGAERQLRRHSGPVRWVELHPDGRLLVSAGSDGQVLLGPADSNESALLLRHPRGVNQAVFGSSGELLATGGLDGVIRVWEVAGLRAAPAGAVEPRPLLELRLEAEAVRVAFSPDGERLAASGGAQESRVWELPSGKLLSRLAHGARGLSLAISPDGGLVAVASHDFSVRVFNASTGQVVGPLLCHGNIVSSLEFHPGGRRLLAAGFDFTARLWDLPTPSQIKRNIHLAAGASKVTHRRDSRHWAWITPNGAPRVQEVATGKDAGLTLDHGEPVRDIQYTADGSGVATTSERAIRLWNATNGASLGRPFRLVSPERQLRLGRDGKTNAVVGVDGSLWIWRPQAGGEAARRLETRLPVQEVAWNPQGELVTSSAEGSCARWDPLSGRALGEAAASDLPVAFTRLSADGLTLLRVGWNFVIEVSDTMSGTRRGGASFHTATIHLTELSPDGSRFVSWSGDGSTRIWSSANAEQLTPPIHAGTVQRAVFSADNRYVCLASGKQARVFSATTGQIVTPPVVLLSEVTYLEFAPDGAHLVVGRNGAARVVSFLPDERPREALLAESTLLSARVLDGTGSTTLLSRGELPAVWERFARLDARRELESSTLVAWHENWAREAQNSNALRRALWHADRLVELEPFTSRHYQRRGKLRQLLGDAGAAVVDETRAAALKALESRAAK